MGSTPIWGRVRDVFFAALDLDPAERSSFVERACAGDAALRMEVLRLIENHRDSTSTLDAPLVGPGLLRETLDHGRFRPGDMLAGRFRIQRLVGEGGMGTVYEAEDLELHDRVALKTIHPSIAHDEKAIGRFKRETQLARKVTHPNVCRVFDLAWHDEVAFLTMEFLEGETLSKRLRRIGRLTPGEWIGLARQMAAGLAAAHAAHIIHRDFKSGNVFLVKDESRVDRAVVTDFGLARVVHSGDAGTTASTAILGTPDYMAPEQWEGGDLTPATDVFALGVVMYEMLSGERPFDAPTPVGRAAKLILTAIPRLRDRAPSLAPVHESIILRCLSFEPAARYATASEVLAALDLGDAGAVRSARRIVNLVTSRRKLWMGAAAVSGLAAGGFAVFGEFSRKPTLSTMRWYNEGLQALADGSYWKAARLLERAVTESPGFALAHARLAEAWWEMDQPDKARESMIRALSAKPWWTGRREARMTEAVRSTVTRDFSAAENVYIDLASGVSGPELSAALVDLGRAQERNDKTQEAAHTFQRAVHADGQNAAAHLRLGMAQIRTQDHVASLNSFEKAESLYRLTGNLEGVGEIHFRRGMMFTNASKLSEARTTLDRAEQLAVTTGNLQQRVKVLFQKSVASQKGGDLDGARAFAQQAVETAAREGYEALAAQGLTELGTVYLSLYNLPESERFLRQAVDIARRNRSRQQLARASSMLGNVLSRSGRSGEALPLLEDAVQFYGQGGFRKQHAQARMVLTQAYTNEAEYARARQVLEALLAEARQAKDNELVVQCQENIATNLVLEGDLPKALGLYQEAARTQAELGKSFALFYNLTNQADLLSMLGRFPEAHQVLEEATKVSRQLKGDLAGRLPHVTAEVLVRERRFAEALPFVREAVAEAKDSSGYRGTALQAVMGQIEAGLGMRSGVARCEAAVKMSKESDPRHQITDWRIRLLEAKILVKDLAGAGELSKDLRERCVRYSQSVRAWQALVLWNRVQPSAERERLAQVEREKLREKWGG